MLLITRRIKKLHGYSSSRRKRLNCAGCDHCRLEPAQLRVAQSASSMVPPLPLTLGTLKEKQAYERELRTVTVGMSLRSMRSHRDIFWYQHTRLYAMLLAGV